MFMLFGEQMLTSSNFTLVAHPSAISQGTLYPSYSSFSRTDVPSSQYRGKVPLFASHHNTPFPYNGKPEIPSI
jgi:hypothetical protein